MAAHTGCIVSVVPPRGARGTDAHGRARVACVAILDQTVGRVAGVEWRLRRIRPLRVAARSSDVVAGADVGTWTWVRVFAQVALGLAGGVHRCMGVRAD